jgi:hypothetical protein
MTSKSSQLNFLFLFTVSVILFSCKKKEVETSEGIFAGDTNTDLMIVTEGVDKTLSPAEGTLSDFVVDLNNDGIDDFNFIAKNKYKSGKFIETELVVNSLNQSEMVKIDTLGTDRIFTAKFKKSALIATFYPFSNKNVVLASANKDTLSNTTNIYCDWCNVSENYMAYRVKRKDSDAFQIGWILISVPDSACNKVLIKSWACRK